MAPTAAYPPKAPASNRCRLRASPATGLVGMQENTFIIDFFGCVGFLPLTSESHIREAMVKIMAPSYSRREAGFGNDAGDQDGPLGALGGGSTSGRADGMNQRIEDPSFCTFWCAVALGALAKGSPIESVERYSQLARDALAASRQGSNIADLAKASAILTYLHTFTGDMAKFRESLELSESLVHTSLEQLSTGTHVGLPDLIQHCRKVSNVMDESAGSTLLNEQAPLQFKDVATEGELYRLIAQSSRAFDRAVYAKNQEMSASVVGNRRFAGPQMGNSPPCDIQPGALSKAIVAVLEEGSFPKFEHLQEAADRPRIRAGIGGLLISGTLVFEKAAERDLDGALERLDRSVEVFERYPGLCHCMTESHTSHTLVAALAGVDDFRARDMYARLRRAYNNCRPSHSLPIPPLEEWQGIRAICSNVHCRVMEDLIDSEYMEVFRTPVRASVYGSAGLTQPLSNPRGQTQSEVSRTDFLYQEIGHPRAASPTTSRAETDAESDCAQYRDSAGVGLASADLGPQASPFHARGSIDPGFDPEVATAAGLLTTPAGVDEHHQVIAGQEDEEIDESDWFEVVNAYRS